MLKLSQFTQKSAQNLQNLIFFCRKNKQNFLLQLMQKRTKFKFLKNVKNSIIQKYIIFQTTTYSVKASKSFRFSYVKLCKGSH